MKKKIFFISIFVILTSCRHLVSTFEDVESAVYYRAKNTKSAESPPDSLKVVTWNIRFGAGRIPWFEDSCGDRVLMTESETLSLLRGVATFIDSIRPDVLLLQEVDVSSKRSAYIDQMQWLLDNTDLNYGVFASMWDVDMVPQGGLGKVNVGNAILSRWEITDAQRIKLSLRTDQWSVKKYFYLRRNILKGKLELNIPNSEKDFYAVNVHATAFATDNTKQNHINKYVEVLNEINDNNDYFVSGGDLNALTPWATKRNFCEEDKCDDDVCDGDFESNTAYEGTYFEFIPNEINLLRPLYNFYPAIDSTALKQNESNYNTHSPWNTSKSIDEYWDRKLDYLFSNKQWSSIGTTHNGVRLLSDHAPVSATIVLGD